MLVPKTQFWQAQCNTSIYLIMVQAALLKTENEFRLNQAEHHQIVSFLCKKPLLRVLYTVGWR